MMHADFPSEILSHAGGQELEKGPCEGAIGGNGQGVRLRLMSQSHCACARVQGVVGKDQGTWEPVNPWTSTLVCL